MPCDACRREPAVVHLTRLDAGGPETVHLCAGCAALRGISTSATLIGDDGLALEPGAASPPVGAEAPLRCAGCGTTLVDLQATRRAGCATCWDTFGGHLREAVRRIHGAVNHVGKGYGGPVAVDDGTFRRREQERLRQAMAVAIAAERFEDAAVLRDQLRACE